MTVQPLQLTLAILKPDLVRRPLAAKAVCALIVKEGFYIIRSTVMRWSYEEAGKFYCQHQEKFFYNRLVQYMSSGPINPMILAHSDAIHHWRKLMGPTKSYVAQATAPHTIRGMYGLTDTRNCTHGADSEEDVRKEIAFVFPDFSLEHWYQNEEPLYRNGDLAIRTKEHLNHSINHTDHSQYNS